MVVVHGGHEVQSKEAPEVCMSKGGSIRRESQVADSSDHSGKLRVLSY